MDEPFATGVVQNITHVAEAAQECGAILLTDAGQAAGKIPLDFSASGAQLMSLSAHKIYGPKGVGALIVDKAVDNNVNNFEPIVLSRTGISVLLRTEYRTIEGHFSVLSRTEF